MASIRQLLVTVPGESPKSTKRTAAALSNAGFDLDATDGLGAFRALDVKDLVALVEPPLTLREQCALKAAIQRAGVDPSEGAAAAAAAAGQGVWSATGAGGAVTDPTTAYIRQCVIPSIPPAALLSGDTAALRDWLLRPVGKGLPLPAVAAKPLLARSPWLGQYVVSTDMQAPDLPTDLAGHVWTVLDGMVRGPGGGCNTEVYVASNIIWLLEHTWWLLMDRLNVTWLKFNRNAVDPSGSTGSGVLAQLRPDFMCWVNGVLLFKGEEKAAEGDLPEAVKELWQKMSEAWIAGTVKATSAATNMRRPCMLAYVAAGSLLQFHAITRAQPQAAGGAGGSASGVGGGVQVEAISHVLDLSKTTDRVLLLVAAFNIWRLLAGYAEMAGAPAAALPVGQTLKSNGTRVTLLPGSPCFVRKVHVNFKDHIEPYTSFEVLQRLYAAMSRPEHKHAIIQAVHGPLLQHGSYVVHLTPPGVPFVEPPSNERELKGVVAGVLRGLVALHAEGFVHRDVRWHNVIYLQAEGRWLLIDLEHAGPAGCDCSKVPSKLKSWSDRTLAPDGTYGKAADLRMVAEQLMVSQEEPGNAPVRLPFKLSHAGLDLRQKLLEADDSRGLSAQAALEHPWLQP